MQSKSARLDRFLSQKLAINRRDVRLFLAQKRVLVDGIAVADINHVIDDFSHIAVDQQLLQAKEPRYVMMNKPLGVVSATKDDKHTTVIDLLEGEVADLHIAGRLDFNSSGLLLLTNDGRWSRRISLPANRVPKLYRVTLQNPVTEKCIQAFSGGIYFPYEGLTTKPAMLNLISSYEVEVTLVEGRYHQIKRMFGRFDNPVLTLHRLVIGNVSLDLSLPSGQSRELRGDEAANITLLD